MKSRGHLRLVSTAPAETEPKGTAEPSAPSMRRLPPLRPARRSAAVRKALRRALADADNMLSVVDSADPRFPRKAADSAGTLSRYGARVARLADELRHALACEERLRLWRKGQPYVE